MLELSLSKVFASPDEWNLFYLDKALLLAYRDLQDNVKYHLGYIRMRDDGHTYIEINGIDFPLERAKEYEAIYFIDAEEEY